MKKLLCLLLAVCFASCLLVACKPTEPEYADNTQYYDAITKTLKLTKSYTDSSSFLDDGIGKAEVDAFTDGDTTRFKLIDGTVLSIRYYEIDTPESTGKVEKWGKAASNFTKKCLESATEIVLESSTGSAAVMDSYHSRWLGYVWYKPEGGEFKNLNLELVENGFSANQGQHTNEYPYYEKFEEAEEFAKSIKLRIFSDLDDPLYSDAPVDTTIKELLDNPDQFYNIETESGSKVRIVAYLADLKIAKSDTHTFIAEQYDPETGAVYQFNVYTMYGTAEASKMKLGHLYTIIGDVQKYGGSYQLSGIAYSATLPIANGTTVKQRNYFLTFDNTKEWFYGNQYSVTLYSDVTVTNVEYANGTLTFTGTAYQCVSADDDGVKSYSDEAVTFTFTVKATQEQAAKIVKDTVISLQAYKLDASSDLITIRNFGSITIRTK